MDIKEPSYTTYKKDFLSNGGEMEKLIREFDWFKTSLGPIETWPQSLKTSVNIVLQSPLPLVMLWGKDGIMLYNDSYSFFAGRRHPSLLGSKVVEGWPEVADFNRYVMAKGLNGETLSYKDQHLILYRNNVAEDVWMDLNYSPIMDESGEPAGVLAIVVETTQRILAEQKQKTAEEALRKSEEKFRALVTASSDVVYRMNADWSEMQQLDGSNFIYNTEGPIHDWIERYIPSSDQQQITKAIQEAIKTKSVFQLEHRIVQADRSIGWTFSRAVPIVDKNGNIVEWFGADSDVTERKRAEEELYEKNQELTKINNDLDNFIYTASHDLRAPVSNLEGLFNTLLSEVQLDGDLAVLKDMIEQSFERFKNTIKDLTEISKVQKGDTEEAELIKFEDVVEDVKAGIKDLIDAHKAKIETTFNVPEVKFSKKNIRSILYNFISNAIKYSSPDRTPVVKVITEKVDNAILLTISDNGLGISADNQKKVFQMFKRFHPQVEGSGIGLYIVKRIIDNAGGKIEVESEIDRGTTFRIVLPQ